jgi:SAM-dependent methyltransferase
VTHAPAAWIVRHAPRVTAGGSILDVACGNGRHSLYFADRGHPITAVDIDTAAARRLAAAARFDLEIVTADLETGEWPLPGRRFNAIVVVNYLHRPLFPHLRESLAEGGVLLYDTFAAGNERFGRPANPDYLLRPGELLREFGSVLEIVAYEHGRLGNSVRQRLCAVRR